MNGRAPPPNIHQSLWQGERAAFHDPAALQGMSPLMQHYLAGQLAHAAEITALLAPYVNRYKRFVAGTFAPTRPVWSLDNRTAGFRICGAGGPGVRVECRIGGADLNPYLAMVGLLAAGLDGIEAALPLGPESRGDAYATETTQALPRTLSEAAERMSGSAMLRHAFGDDVVDHYTRAARWEVEKQDRVVTDWELRRDLERR